MSLYVEVGTDIQVYEDSTKDNCKFGLKIVDKVLSTPLVYEASSRVKLAAGASNIAVNFQSVADAKLIVMKSASAFTVKFNANTNPALTLTPQIETSTSVTTPAFLAMLGSGVTSLFLTNPSATAVIEVDIGIAGT